MCPLAILKRFGMSFEAIPVPLYLIEISYTWSIRRAVIAISPPTEVNYIAFDKRFLSMVLTICTSAEAKKLSGQFMTILIFFFAADASAKEIFSLITFPKEKLVG